MGLGDSLSTKLLSRYHVLGAGRSEINRGRHVPRHLPQRIPILTRNTGIERTISSNKLRDYKREENQTEKSRVSWQHVREI